MPLSRPLTTEEIMERLGRMCQLGTSVMCRTTFPSGPSKWYLSMRGIYGDPMDGSGASPQEAIINGWNAITDPKRPATLIRYFCRSDEPIPGNGPQVWVRWNHDLDDWEDVEPPKDSSFASKASEIRSYADHKWREASI